MAIGKENLSENKMRKYLENCQLTCKRALQLLCFSLISKLWDYQKENNVAFTPEQATTCRNFFEDEFELDICGYAHFLKVLTGIFLGNGLSFPMAELNDRQLPLGEDNDFLAACHQLQTIEQLLDPVLFQLTTAPKPKPAWQPCWHR